MTSLALAFSFSVSSPLSVAVAYAQTTSADSSQPPDTQTNTTTDQGSTGATPSQSGLNFTVTGEPGAPVTAPVDIAAPSDTGAVANAPAPTDQSSQPTTGQASTDQTANTPTTPTNPQTPLAPLTPSSGISNSYPDLLKYPLKPTPDASGALSLQYPISVPPGRGQMTPDLRLVYTSNPSPNDSQFGYGWSINIPYIQRINRMGVDQLYATNYYTSTMDGELASTSATTYGAKFENGDFRQYSFSTSTNAWIVTDKNGTTYKFGSTAASRQDPGGSTTIYKWMLDEIRDTNNNYIKFTYTKDSGQIYPSSIVYTGNGSTDGPFTVNFLTASRSDTHPTYNTGYSVTTNYRINEIDVLVSGTWVKKYLLSYGTGDNGVRSMLTQITEEGQDDSSNTITLPSTSETYATSSLKWTSVDTNTQWSGGDDGGGGLTYIDVNGDGLTDYIFTIPGQSLQVYINNGSNFVLNTNWHVPGLLNQSTDSGWRIADVNGDGLPDFVYSAYNGGALTSRVWINTGSDWVQDTSWPAMPSGFAYKAGSATSTCGMEFVDLNGDGLPDLVGASPTVCGGSFGQYVNNGHGWAGTSNWSGCAGGAGSGITFIDVNGDGLPDCVNAIGSPQININTGSGFSLDTGWHLPGPVNLSSNDQGFRFGDMNGDGLPDVVQSVAVWNGVSAYNSSSTIFYNTGSDWVNSTAASGTLPVNSGTGSGAFLIKGAISTVSGNTVLTDVSGDGLPDLLSAGSGNINPATYTNNGPTVDLLTQLGYRTGGKTNIGYKPSAQIVNGGGGLKNPLLPMIINTVNYVQDDDGLGNVATTTAYSYGGGRFYYNGPFDRRLAGFATTTATDAAGNVTTTFFHTASSTDSTHGAYNDDEAKIGKVYRVEKADGSGNLYQKTITRWDDTEIATTSPRWFVKVSTTLSSMYDGNGTHKDTAEAYTNENAHGNLVQRIQYDQVNGNDDGTFTDTGTDLASTTITYAASSTNATMAGFVATSTTQDQSSNKVSETRHSYDGLSLGSVSAGNETKTETWKSGSSYASTTKAYDGTYGLVTQSKDADGNATTYTLDSNNLYPATTTNALSQATGYVYDYASGKVKRTFDPNSHLSVTAYDALRRPVSVAVPDPSTGNLATSTTYVYTDSSTPGATSIQKTSYQNAATSTDDYTYLDGLGRNIQERTTAQGNSTYAVKDWTYNNLGLLASESLPYFASSTSRSSATSTSALFTTYSYDPMQRVLKIANAVGSTTNAYDDWTLTVTDPNGKVKDYTKDAYGNLASVVEHVGGSNQTTSYAYDLNNNLTKITDAAGNVRNFTYDGMNRRLSTEDLHASGDSTYGTSTFAYDNAGNLTQKVDPKSQTVNYTYDALNRPLTEDYTGQAGTEVTYAYDNCANGKGRFCAATTTNAGVTVATTDAYNPLGLVSSEVKYVNGNYYTTSNTYDRLGNQTDIVYPDNSEVLYTRDNSNQITTAQQREGASSPWRTLASGITYSPLGQEQTIQWGSGATTTNTYDANNLYRLTHKVTLLPDSGDWGTALSSNAMGFITSNFSHAASSSGATPPYPSVNLNSDGLWLSHSLTYNDSFEYGTNSWSFYAGSASATNAVDCTVAYSGGCSDKVAVATTSVSYLPQLMQIVRLDPNTNYTLKFRIKASATTTFEASVQQNHDQYLMQGVDKYPTATPSWQEFSYYFSSAATTTDYNTRLIFSLGYSNSNTYWIDDVELIPDGVSTVLNPSFENISDPTNNNYGYSFWTKGGSSEATESTDCSTPTTDGACSANINVLVASSTDWYVQFMQTQALATNTPYLLTFDAKSTVQRDADVVLQQNHSPNNLFTGFNHFTIYPTWNHYAIELTPTGGDVNGRWDFNLAVATSTVWFDNIHFFKKQNSKVTAPPPYFTGIYNAIGTSTASAYQIQVIKRGGDWGNPLWDSGKTTLSPQTPNNGRMATSTYAGPSLPADGTDAEKYFWRIKMWDQSNNASPWTNGTDYFMTTGNRVQDLSYTYDADGNITHLVDASFTKTAKTVDYTYDDLNRLTKASTTPDVSSGAPNSGRNVTESWTYDALGNILTDATTTGGTIATTTYSYTGNSGSNYANPDAATQVGAATLSYDKNGNLTAGQGGFSASWDWRNRLSIATSSVETAVYSYDENDKRVRVVAGSNFFHYPNDLYSYDFTAGLPTKHVLLNGHEIATVNGASGSGVIDYDYTDNLGSTGVVADPSNRVQEVTDYTPFGAIKNHDQLAGYTELRKYTGKPFDTDTGLEYYNARYYNPAQGQFLSEDPSFLDLGTPNLAGDVQQSTLLTNPATVGLAAFTSAVSGNDTNQKVLTLSLADPQSLNSDSFVESNPIKNVDPNGKELISATIFGLAGGTVSYSLNGIANATGVQTGLSNKEAFVLGFGSGFGFGLAFSPSGAAAGAALASLAIDKVEGKQLNYTKAATEAAENYGLGLISKFAPAQLINIPELTGQLGELNKFSTNEVINGVIRSSGLPVVQSIFKKLPSFQNTFLINTNGGNQGATRSQTSRGGGSAVFRCYGTCAH